MLVELIIKVEVDFIIGESEKGDHMTPDINEDDYIEVVKMETIFDGYEMDVKEIDKIEEKVNDVLMASPKLLKKMKEDYYGIR